MLAKDIPISRVAKVISTGKGEKVIADGTIYMMMFYGNFLLKFWPKTSQGATIERALYNDEWEVELLPKTTAITFVMDGEHWDRPDDYKSDYND